MRAPLLALLLAVTAPAAGHDLEYRLSEGRATVLQLFFADGKPLAFEACEVWREGEGVPFQVGRTDAAGRIAFLPDRPGNWRVKAYTADGHGVDVQITTDAGGAPAAIDQPLYERFGRAVAGVALILGLFALAQFALRRKAR